MLVLLSFALVLVATVLLVLGLLNDDGITLIYFSIASSVAAAVVLMVGLRLNKPRGERRSSEPAPLPEPRVEPLPAPAAAVGATAETATVAAPAAESSEWLASDQETWPATDTWEEGDEVEFPIADYDTLTVGQILPLLPQLYVDEIDVVEERERLTKARPQVLAKLAELRDASGGEDAADPLASYTEAPAASWDDDDDWFPIEDYESLSAAQIRPLLPELDAEELALVRTRELSLGRRRSLLDEIDRQLGVSPAPSAPARKAPAKKAAAAPARQRTTTAAPVKKAPAKSAPAKKATTKAAPARTTATKSAPAKRSAPAAKSAPTRKAAPATKAAAPAKRTASKGTPAKKAAAPAKQAVTKATAAKKATKAAPAKKAPAKKAPAKKATKR